MKTIIFFTIALILTVFSVKAQHDPMFSQYMLNNFVINPAVAGSTEYWPIILSARNQWIGVDGAPSTQVLSGHGNPLPYDNMGLGAYFYNDKYGPFGQTGINLAYAYHLSLDGLGIPSFFGNNQKLSFGLSFSNIFQRLNMDEIHFYNPDIVDTKTRESDYIPDAGFGMYFYSDKWYTGLSTVHLLSRKISYGESSSFNRFSRGYFANIGYYLDLENYITHLKAEPSIMIQYASANGPMQLDINLKASYNDKIWAGISYRTGKTFMIFSGVKYERYMLAYAFDYAFNSLTSNTAGSHEIILGVNLNDKSLRNKASF